MSALLLAAFAIAVLGTVSSSVYLGMALLAALRHQRRARASAKASAASSVELPFVSVLKPLHGDEPRLEENLESFLLQDYPSFELVFGCRNESDAALAVVERLRARHPRVPVRIVLSGEPRWPSAKVWSLDKMIASSSAQYLVLSDSDILVGPGFLRAVIPPLVPSRGQHSPEPYFPEEAALVTCLYAGIPAPGLWSHLEALGMSAELPSGVLIAQMLEGMRFALGAAIAVRRDALETIGGIGSCAEYYSDDFVLGSRICQAGYRVELSRHRVGHVLCATSLGRSFGAQLRWMQSTRYSRPLGHLGTGLTFATPFGLLGLAAACAIGHPVLGVALLAAALLNRIVQSVAIGYGVIGDRRALTLAWLYPLRDLLGFFVWCASYLGGPTFRWRGELYRFTRGGRIVSVERGSQAQPE